MQITKWGSSVVGILVSLLILCMVCESKNQKNIQNNISCSHSDTVTQSQCCDELERQEREKYYREYESRGRQKYYKIPCPWKNEE